MDEINKLGKNDELDEMLVAMSQMAKLSVHFFNELRREGMPSAMAAQLTQTWLATLMGGTKK